MGGPPNQPNPLYLRPALAPRSAALTTAAAFLHTLADGLGTPLNVVIPDQIAENAARFDAVLRRHRLAGGVYFAHKASASSALLRRLAATDSCVDVASLEELQHSFACGFTPDRITATGPKDPAFRYLGTRVGVTFHVDGQGELEALAGLVRTTASLRSGCCCGCPGSPPPGSAG